MLSCTWVTVAVLFGEPRIYGGELYLHQIYTAWCILRGFLYGFILYVLINFVSMHFIIQTK